MGVGVLLGAVPLVERWLMLVAFAAVLVGFGYWKGLQHEEVKFDKYKAQQEELLQVATAKAMAKTQELTVANAKVTNDYLKQKRLRVADAAVASGRLQELTSAVSSTSSSGASGTGGVVDPRDSIIVQCASALTDLDRYAKDVADRAAALQGYASEVCVR